MELYLGVYSQWGHTMVPGNKESKVTLPIAYRKFYLPFCNLRYDYQSNFNINMVCNYSGIVDNTQLLVVSDLYAEADVGKMIEAFWVTLGV